MNFFSDINNKKISRGVILFFILLLAFFLRTWNLSTNPPELYCDELSDFVSVRSIMETGKDYNGSLSLYLYNAIEPHPPIYGYFSYFFTRFLGEEAFGIRFASVFFGLVSVFFLYLFVQQLTKNAIPALIAAFTLGIVPLFVHFGRWGIATASLVPFFVGGMYFFIKGISEERKGLTILGSIFFSLAIYTYPASPLFAFLFFVTLLILNYKYFLKHKILLLICMGAAFLFAVPYIILAFLDPSLLGRAKGIATFAAGINKDTIAIFFNNYFAHYSLNYLFISGDPNPAHGGPVGIIYWWMLPFIIAGMLFARRFIAEKQNVIFLFIWLIIFPLAASFTNDGIPHGTRTLVGIPIFSIFCGLGFLHIYEWLKKLKDSKKIIKLSAIALTIIVLFNLIVFIKIYYIEYPKTSMPTYEYSHTQIYKYIIENQDKYERLFVSGVANEATVRVYNADKVKLDIFDNPEDPRMQMPKTLAVLSADQPQPYNYQLVYSVVMNGDTPCYNIWANP